MCFPLSGGHTQGDARGVSTQGVLEFVGVHSSMAWSGSQTEASELSTFDDSLVTPRAREMDILI